MGRVLELDDPEVIASFCGRDPGLHIYELGDLDPFFWPHTRWFALEQGDQAAALALLYTGARVPSLLAFPHGEDAALPELLARIAPRLPSPLYAHLGVHPERPLVEALGPRFEARHHGRHFKMVLREPEAVVAVDAGALERLGPAQLDEVLAFYAASYPRNWFEPRMLETGQYLALREPASGGSLACVAGVHVYAPGQGVAALGNVTTAPAQRGRGLARRTVAGLCQRLLPRCPTLGLNVHADNAPARALYEGLGFRITAAYDEYELRAVAPAPRSRRGVM